jgi:hypothetical protein
MKGEEKFLPTCVHGHVAKSNAAVDKPILVGPRGFIGVGLRWEFGAAFAHMRDIVIDLLVEGHNPCDRPHGNLGVAQETPDPELAGIRMAFL